MNKPSSPWSIKGVSPEAREAAKQGARISQQPLGRWLSQVIRVTSENEADPPAGTNGANSSAPTDWADAPPSTATTWQEAVVRLEAKIADTERQAAAVIQPIGEAVDRVDGRLEAIEAYVLRRPRRSYLTRLFRR
jgi:localization factor PodJL